MPARAAGRLSVVGTGIRLAGQITVESRNLIQHADQVFAVMADTWSQEWLRRLNSNVTSLQDCYADGKQRDNSYTEMVDAILAAVRQGLRVCAVFYGHPGVFVYPSHEAVRRARAEGYEARLYPGISAEDCLFADLGIDPARSGCQSYEAMDFLLYGRVIDPTAALILWQIATLGDYTRSTFETDPRWVAALSEVLQKHYPAGHEVIVYEAASFPLDEPRVDRVGLDRLASMTFSQAATLYVPPLRAPHLSRDRLRRLGVSEEALARSHYQAVR